MEGNSRVQRLHATQQTAAKHSPPLEGLGVGFYTHKKSSLETALKVRLSWQDCSKAVSPSYTEQTLLHRINFPFIAIAFEIL
jgi:hypothetical protein